MPTRITLQPLQVGADLRCVLIMKIAIFLECLVNNSPKNIPRGASGEPSRTIHRIRFTIFRITPLELPRNGSTPVAASYTLENEKRSVRKLARTCSGEVQFVPSADRTRQVLFNVTNDGEDNSTTFANPKSSTLACPRLVTKMFAGLMSR